MRLTPALRAGSIPQVPVGICAPITGTVENWPMQMGYAIVDTGATHTVLARRLVEMLGLTKVGERPIQGATGAGRAELFEAMVALTFKDHEGRERERFFDVTVAVGGLLESPQAPDAYLGRNLLVQLAGMHFDFTKGEFELVANETSGREL